MKFTEYVKTGERSFAELSWNCQNAADISQNLLLKIVNDNKETEYGRQYSFENIHTVEEYKEKVPFTSYPDYLERINRMKKGETDLLTVYPTVYFARTSGSVGVPKSIPVSQKTLDIYTKYTHGMYTYLCDRYLKNHENRSLTEGTFVTTVVAHAEKLKSGINCGAISSATYSSMRPMMEDIWGIPDFSVYSDEEADFYFLKTLFALKNKDIICLDAPFATAVYDFLYYISRKWGVLCQVIRSGKLPDGVALSEDLRKKVMEILKPDEERADELEKIFREESQPLSRKIWPRLEFCNCIGAAAFMPYVEKIKMYTGDIPISYSAYAASEAFIATVTAMNSTEYTVVPEAGFFEFLPVDRKENDQEKLKHRTLNIDELEIGKDYEIIVTNLSGFYRYRLDDVITVLGYNGKSPKIRFKYRLSQNISMAGEKTSMDCVADVIEKVEKKFHAVIPDYSVCANYDAEPGRYRLYMETNDSFTKEIVPALQDYCEKILEENNPSYGKKVRMGILLPLEIVFLQKDTYWLYRDILIYRGISQNQIKPVRLIDNPWKEKFFAGLTEHDGENKFRN